MGFGDEKEPPTYVVTITGLFLLPWLMALDGLTTMFLWRWFIAPTFGVAELRVMQAVGLGLVIAFLTHKARPTNEGSKYKVFIHLAADSIVTPVFTLGIGWVIHQFV